MGERLSGSSWDGVGIKFFVGAFDLKALAQLGVWSRLFLSAELIAPTVFIAPNWDPLQRAEVSGAFPRSRQSTVVLAEDPDERWRSLIQPDRPERSFAVVYSGAKNHVFVGTPTEEAWDLFLSLVRATTAPTE